MADVKEAKEKNPSGAGTNKSESEPISGTGNTLKDTTETQSEIDKIISQYTQDMSIQKDEEEPSKVPGGELDLEVPVKKKRTRKTKATIGGEVMTGAMFLFLVDTIFPAVICGINNRFTKQKVSPEKLMLTTSQKRELEPLAQEVANRLQATGDPVVVFLLTMISLYGVNLMMARAQGF